MASPKSVGKSFQKSKGKRFGKKKKESMEEENRMLMLDTLLPAGAQSNVSPYLAVVAIDFGTTYSGYAYAFTHDPSIIHIMDQRQFGIRGGNYSTQMPTVLLLDEDSKLHSFGYEAQETYRDMDEKESLRWLYFEKFKMELHSRDNLHSDMELVAANGLTLPAITVFARAMEYFKDCSLREINELSSAEITNANIQWVITVPAIWRPSARQFMRKAAVEAGLVSSKNPRQLILSLEPEAASIYCHQLQLKECSIQTSQSVTTIGIQRYSLSCSSSSSNSSSTGCSPIHHSTPSLSTSTDNLDLSKPIAPIVPGESYIVADCGGGTIDITVHQVDDNGQLKELHKSTGGAWGSVGVDCQFEMLLVSIFGEQIIQGFIDRHPISWLELMKSFEAKKLAFNQLRHNASNILLPFAFIDYYRKRTRASVEDAIIKYGKPGVVWSNQGMLRLQGSVMISFFDPVVTTIIKHIQQIINHADLSTTSINYLFLVGGFAESPVLQQSIQETFGSQMKVVIPHDPSLTILKGAVQFGLNPNIITIRRATLTYGVGCLHKFNPDVHPPSKKVTKNDIEWCTEVFDTFVSSGQPLPQGFTVTRSYKLAQSSLQSTVISVFASRSSSVKYVTDPGVKKIGELRLNLLDFNGDSQKREVRMAMTFGDTEISVKGFDTESGQIAFSQIDFLC